MASLPRTVPHTPGTAAGGPRAEPRRRLDRPTRSTIGPGSASRRRQGRGARPDYGTLTAPRTAGAVERTLAGIAAGHNDTSVPSSSRTPPAQIQLTSGLTKTARLTFAAAPSPSQPASTT